MAFLTKIFIEPLEKLGFMLIEAGFPNGAYPTNRA